MRTLLIPIALVGAAACGMQTAWMPLNTPPRPMVARAKQQVQIFTAQKPTQPHVEVGLITVGLQSQYSGSTNLEMIDQGPRGGRPPRWSSRTNRT